MIPNWTTWTVSGRWLHLPAHGAVRMPSASHAQSAADAVNALAGIPDPAAFRECWEEMRKALAIISAMTTRGASGIVIENMLERAITLAENAYARAAAVLPAAVEPGGERGGD